MDMKFTNLLIYFVSVVHHFSVLECRDVFFLVHNYDQAKSYCITNTSYGLSWIEEDETSAQSRKILNCFALITTGRRKEISNAFW
jgi:hypothetical protein